VGLETKSVNIDDPKLKPLTKEFYVLSKRGAPPS